MSFLALCGAPGNRLGAQFPDEKRKVLVVDCAFKYANMIFRWRRRQVRIVKVEESSHR
ncbi:MAG: hypothetical protein MHPSP_002084, partial [Paramarteilia canceri]